MVKGSNEVLVGVISRVLEYVDVESTIVKRMQVSHVPSERKSGCGEVTHRPASIFVTVRGHRAGNDNLVIVDVATAISVIVNVREFVIRAFTTRGEGTREGQNLR